MAHFGVTDCLALQYTLSPTDMILLNYLHSGCICIEVMLSFAGTLLLFFINLMQSLTAGRKLTVIHFKTYNHADKIMTKFPCVHFY